MVVSAYAAAVLPVDLPVECPCARAVVLQIAVLTCASVLVAAQVLHLLVVLCLCPAVLVLVLAARWSCLVARAVVVQAVV